MRHVFGGKKLDVVSLRTTNLVEARHALAARLSEFDKLVAAARGTVDPTHHSKAIRPIPHVPERDEIDRAVRIWLADHEHKQLPVELRRADPVSDLVQEHEQARIGTKRGILSREPAAQLQTRWIAEHLIDENDWIMPPNGEMAEYLVRTVARAEMVWFDTVRAEVLFDDRPVPSGIFTAEHYRQDEEKAGLSGNGKPVSIMSLFDQYVTEAQPAPATVKAWRGCLQSLVDHLGHDNAGDVSKSDIVGWKDALLLPVGDMAPRSHNTISKKYLAAAKTVFGWAERNDRLPTNPAATVSIIVPKKRRLRSERGLTDIEARIVLSAASRAEPDHVPLRGFARRWIPWLCAYTGARVGEIAQLRAQDVFQHEKGIWCIRITPEAGGQKANRAREVPLHPHLIEQGLIQAINQRKGPLFYDPSKHRGGSEGNPQYKKVAERLAKWVRELGVTDRELLPNHGWRHRFKTVARSSRMDHEARDNIQGHAAKTEGDKYGETTIPFRYEEICKLPKYTLD